MNTDKTQSFLRVCLCSSVALFGLLRGETGSEVCANCHREIFEAYQATGMARSSGQFTGIESEVAFTHKLTGVGYRVFRQAGAAWFSFDITGVHGQRRLEYFVSSGSVGRSYLYTVGGFLYQAPVSLYFAPGKLAFFAGCRS